MSMLRLCAMTSKLFAAAVTLAGIAGLADAQDATVAEDRRLGIRYSAFSSGGNIAKLTDVSYAINPPSMATVELPRDGDNPAIAAFVRPTGTLGTFTVIVSGKNSRGIVKSSLPYTVEVVAGAAETVAIETVGEFDLAGIPELPRDYVDTDFDQDVMKILAAAKAMKAAGILPPSPVSNRLLLDYYNEHLANGHG